MIRKSAWRQFMCLALALLATAAALPVAASSEASGVPPSGVRSGTDGSEAATTLAELQKELDSTAMRYEPEPDAWALAIKVDRFLDTAPQSAEAYSVLGRAIVLMEILPDTAAEARKLRHARTPEEAFAAAHALDPDNGAYLLDWVEAAPETEETGAALEGYLSRYPGDPRACWLAARREGVERERAIELLRQAKECLPAAKLLLGRCLEEHGDLAAADEAYGMGGHASCGNPRSNWLDRDFLWRGAAMFGSARIALLRGDALEAARLLRLFDKYRFDLMTPIVADEDRDGLWKKIEKAAPEWPIFVPSRAAAPEEALEALKLAALAADDEAFLRFLGPPLVSTKAREDDEGILRSSCVGIYTTLPVAVANVVCQVWSVVFETPGEFECRATVEKGATCRDVSGGGKQAAELDLRLGREGWRVVAVRAGMGRGSGDD